MHERSPAGAGDLPKQLFFLRGKIMNFVNSFMILQPCLLLLFLYSFLFTCIRIQNECVQNTASD